MSSVGNIELIVTMVCTEYNLNKFEQTCGIVPN